MNKLLVQVNLDYNGEYDFNNYGMEVYWVDKYSQDLYGIQGELTKGEVESIPFVIHVESK
jgi:hypothetical protein